ncbi:hypothetical protein SESBI_40121 [Sesbania bispinosa]|nr:hypothetical protein SESBI_40121 [Sesbania bispinosa]
MAWLWNSMVLEISDTCLFLKSTREIWETVEQTYSKAKDVVQIYDVKVKTMAIKQGNKSITKYANQLKAIWMEFDHYRVIKTKCLEDSTILKEYIEQDRVYDFWVGLNPEYDQGKSGFPNIEKKTLGGLVYLLQQVAPHKGEVLEIIWKTHQAENGGRKEALQKGEGQAHIVNGQGEESVQLNHEEIERIHPLPITRY